MNLQRLTDSIAALTAVSAVSMGFSLAIVHPISTHILNESQSVTENLYLTGILMLAVILSSAAIGFLVIRLIWGPQIPHKASSKNDPEDLDEAAEMRAMKSTGTKRVVVLILTLAIVTIIFDYVGNGVLISDVRAVRVLTMLRSTSGQDRADAVHEAIIIVSDSRVKDALKHIITTPGEAREWAAYAIGARNDKELADDLASLLRSGNDREKSAAAVALARMGDERLIEIGIKAFNTMSEKYKIDIMKALGMLGKRHYMQKANLQTAGVFLATMINDKSTEKKMKQLAIWAAGNFEAPETLKSIEELLEKGTDTASMCIGLEALGKIGAESSSPKLLEALYKFDKSIQCPEIVVADFTGHEVLICSRINIIERLLHEIAHIGDRRAREELQKISKDPAFTPAAQGLASEIVFQMKYKPVEPIPEQ